MTTSPSPKISLRVRDLRTGSLGSVSFDTAEAAKAWLQERPKLVDVLGVVGSAIDHETDVSLRSAMRPLDAEEKAAEERLAAEDELRAVARAEQERAKAQQEREVARKEDAGANPNRPMTIRYRFDKGLSIGEPNDSREITAEAREAALAWVAERDSWVHDRGQCVGEASVQLWPGPLPAEARGERVLSGSFVPVTAAPKRDEN
jgi:hypothetical protein